MIPRTTRNFSRLQTKCANCAHTEWDHYMHAVGSRTACDVGGCHCREFRPVTDDALSDIVYPHQPAHSHVAVMERALAVIRVAHSDYEAALARREHGSVAADRFIRAVADALGGRCFHVHRREITALQTNIEDGRLVKLRTWWCPDCSEKWETRDDLGQVESISISVKMVQP